MAKCDLIWLSNLTKAKFLLDISSYPLVIFHFVSVGRIYSLVTSKGEEHICVSVHGMMEGNAGFVKIIILCSSQTTSATLSLLLDRCQQICVSVNMCVHVVFNMAAQSIAIKTCNDAISHLM